MELNKKKVHRLWKEEGLQVHRAPRRKRAGQSSVPVIEADSPNVVWALDFQFDSTVDGRKIKIASMVDEHTRVSLLNVVERLGEPVVPRYAGRNVGDATGAAAMGSGSPNDGHVRWSVSTAPRCD